MPYILCNEYKVIDYKRESLYQNEIHCQVYFEQTLFIYYIITGLPHPVSNAMIVNGNAKKSVRAAVKPAKFSYSLQQRKKP